MSNRFFISKNSFINKKSEGHPSEDNKKFLKPEEKMNRLRLFIFSLWNEICAKACA